MTTALMNDMSVPAPTPIAPPIESMVLADLLGGLRGRPLVEQRRRECGDARPALGFLRGARADDQAEADHRLLVVRDGDDLQTVGQRLDRVGRELHGAADRRPRRPLGRPVPRLRGRRRGQTEGASEARAVPPKRRRREGRRREGGRREGGSSPRCSLRQDRDHRAGSPA